MNGDAKLVGLSLIPAIKNCTLLKKTVKCSERHLEFFVTLTHVAAPIMGVTLHLKKNVLTVLKSTTLLSKGLKSV